MDKQIVNEIHNQLGGSKFDTMTGAYYKCYDKVSFSCRFRGCRKAHYVVITINDMDLYTMEFYKVGNKFVAKVKEYKNIQAKQLQELFTRFTGLDTHL